MGATLASAIPVSTITTQITDMAPFLAVLVGAAFTYLVVRRSIKGAGGGKAKI